MDRDALAKIIWNKRLHEVTEEESAAVVQQYPFFSAARFLYLDKLKGNKEAYAGQAQKAILFYHHPTTFPLFLNPPEDVSFENKITPLTDVITSSDTDTKDDEEWISEQATSNTSLVESADKISTSDEQLVFEPFHTVDYFASQGIKPSADEMPKDKFGKQLKSFTDWLKTMKKLPAHEISKNAITEKNVEHLAAHSVEDASVITESMAEVWLKQGNSEKAIATYRKLSLQNPAKSAYFAAKIESIKS